MKRKRLIKADGFTLLEALFAVILIGLGVVSLVAASGAFTVANSAGLDISTAEFLIEEIREMTASIPFENLAALDGQTYSPPVDVTQISLNDFANFTQQIMAQNVSATDLTTPQSGSDFIRMEVTILKNGLPVNSASWIRANIN